MFPRADSFRRFLLVPVSGGRKNVFFHSSSTVCLAAAKSRKKRSTTGQGKAFRADRVLSNRGWGSRSECFDLLKQRRVSQLVEGGEFQRIMGPSEKISMDADLWVDESKQVDKPAPLLLVYHKPKWMLSVMSDEKGRKNLGDLDFISKLKMHPVGRLDYDTSGLILFSSDGSLTQTLLHPNHDIQKEYVALVVGEVIEAELRNKLAQGVTTSIGAFPAHVAAAKSIETDKVKPLIADILSNLPPEYDVDRLDEKGYLFFKDADQVSEVRLIVEEGKHRMVRRILANSGFPVISLKRERLGTIELGDLEEGSHRILLPHEEQWARSLLKESKVQD